jgi:RMKL-like, methyltransferase domain
MVAAVERTLRIGLATQGLLDPNVMVLDPACGTGTFLIAAATLGAERARERWGEGSIAGEMKALAARLHGFEFLVGPYAVAHYRMLREIAAAGAVQDKRLPIYLADTLAPPGQALGITGHLGFFSAPIVEERAVHHRQKATESSGNVFSSLPQPASRTGAFRSSQNPLSQPAVIAVSSPHPSCDRADYRRSREAGRPVSADPRLYGNCLKVKVRLAVA